MTWVLFVTILLIELPFMMGWTAVNVMPSQPYGVYRIRALNGILQRDDLISFRTDASTHLMRERHGWLAGFWPILKPVAGLPGDLVCHGPDGIFIRRRDSGEVLDYGPTHLPATMPAQGTCETVPEQMIYAASDEPRSLDSRYLGWVPMPAIRGIASPLWTW
jgi:type IV secretory pathway protease TraF